MLPSISLQQGIEALILDVVCAPIASLTRGLCIVLLLRNKVVCLEVRIFIQALFLTVDVPALALPGGYIKGYVCNL